MKVFDLTLPFDEHSPVFPGAPNPKISNLLTIEKNGFNELILSFPSHTGTHIDAPFHCIKNGKKLSDFDISYFVGNAIVFDCKNQKEILLSDSELSIIKEDDFVFFNTGYSDNYLKPGYFSEYPVISEKTADALVAKKVRVVGLDSPSPDKEPFKIHNILLGKNIPIIENLFNLSKVTINRFKCIISPLNIKNGDGAPCRVIAML
ncbi:MAG: cyclase family protein [Candidatus Micrarchaeota archaeon]|nr:cyclase family protein [Candidatus Micrarchaeota archaeon]